jgi:hypothetical protein
LRSYINGTYQYMQNGVTVYTQDGNYTQDPYFGEV